jgi:hypothetical protein
MATAPIADKPRCDVTGCGAHATRSTDGSETDHLGRPALRAINVCDHHTNWPHSSDAARFAAEPTYRDRVRS